MSFFSKPRLMGFIGNILEHYDQALFGMLAPFIAPLFFDPEDQLTGLILTYAILPLGFISKPLGSLFFGLIGDRKGRKYALYYSLVGMGIVTVGMGCLPVYQDVGIVAPISLAMGKMVQSFFAAGQSTGGSIFILEQTEEAKRSWVSGLYNSSTMLGIILASGLVTLLSFFHCVEHGWRFLYWVGGATALFGIFLRSVREEPLQKPKQNVLQVLREQKMALLRMTLAAGFSYTTYSFAFTLMNGYIPLVTTLSKTDVMQVNTTMLIADMALLPLLGYLAQKMGKEKVMLWGALGSALGAIPLFAILDHASLGLVIVVRFIIMMLGVAFGAPYQVWALEQVSPEHRYIILSLGSSLGSQLIGAPTSMICIGLYQQTGWVAAPGLYLLIIAGAASITLYRSLIKVPQQSL